MKTMKRQFHNKQTYNKGNKKFREAIMKLTIKKWEKNTNLNFRIKVFEKQSK